MTLDAGIGANSASGIYDIDNSSVWEPDLLDQAYVLQGSTAGTRTKQTFSVWIKRTELDSDQYIFEGGTGNANDTQFGIQFSASNKLQIMRGHTSGGYQYLLNTNRVFRDTSAWYHIVVAVDTTLGTADNRVRLYVNGVEETSFANRNNPSQNDNLGTFAANSQISLGVSANLGKYIAAYIAHPALVYNAQLPPTDFGEFDSDSGIWKPKDLSAIDFGTYGYWLKNETSNQMYNDSSGSSNNFDRWDATIAQSTDTPTNSFCTMNNNSRTNGNIRTNYGGTYVGTDGGSGWCSMNATMGVSNGKWYWEGQRENNSDGTYIMPGVAGWNDPWIPHRSGGYYNGNVATGASTGWYYLNGTTYNGTGTWYGPAQGDLTMFALDMDNKKLYYGKNGTWQNSSNPATNTNGQDIGSIWSGVSGGTEIVLPSVSVYQGNRTRMNFGGYFRLNQALASGNADANGYGTFEYAPPSGFYALCTKNLAEFG